ncbi:MAG: helix-turn-helix transcriptional regulator [bacterium]
MVVLNGEPVRYMSSIRNMDTDQPDFGHMTLDALVCEKIRGLRQARGWTQDAAATALGLSLSGLRRLEQGRQAWSLEQLEKAAAVFGVSPASLIAPTSEAVSTGVDQAIASGDSIGALRALADALEARPADQASDDANARRLLAAYTARDWPTLMRLCAELAEAWGIDR